MTPLGIGRIVFYSLISFLSAGVAGLSGYLLSLVSAAEGGSTVGFDFLTFGLAVGIITVILILVVRVMDWTMQSSPMSKTAIELGWLGVLWVLWTAAAGYTTSLIAPLSLGTCGAYEAYDPGVSAICMEVQALEGVSWFVWLLVTGIFTWILVFAIVAHNRGYPQVWMSHSGRFVMGTGPGAAPRGGIAKYTSVGTNDYGMEQMRGYAAPKGNQPYPQPYQAGAYNQPYHNQSYPAYNQSAVYNQAGPYSHPAPYDQPAQSQPSQRTAYTQPGQAQPPPGQRTSYIQPGQAQPQPNQRTSYIQPAQAQAQAQSNQRASYIQPAQSPPQPNQQVPYARPAQAQTPPTQEGYAPQQQVKRQSPPPQQQQQSQRAAYPQFQQAQQRLAQQGQEHRPPPGAAPAQNPYAQRTAQGYSYGRAEL